MWIKIVIIIIIIIVSYYFDYTIQLIKIVFNETEINCNYLLK